MLGFLRFLSIAGCASASLHHYYVGQQGGSMIHALEIDDVAHTLVEMGMIPAAGSSPSLALDHSKKYLFGSNPTGGKLTRYAVQTDYSLKTEGSTDLPASCNTTNFNSLRLTPSPYAPYQIYGTASTGTCSTIFSTSVSGFNVLRSREFAGDIRSLAWSPNGRHLHALDSHSSKSSATSIFNFFMAPEPTLNDQNGTDVLTNTTNAEQMVTHPTGNLVYVVTKDTNELVTIPLLEEKSIDPSATPSRYKILPSTLDATQYTTSTLTISSSKSTLWTLSQSTTQAVVTVFSLNEKTGEVINAVARAAWSGMGGIGSGQLAPAPFEGNDIVAVANSPVGMVAFLGLDKGTTTAGQKGDVKIESDNFLEDIWMMNVDSEAAAAPRLKSFGRIDLGLDSLGEGVWVD